MNLQNSAHTTQQRTRLLVLAGIVVAVAIALVTFGALGGQANSQAADVDAAAKSDRLAAAATVEPGSSTEILKTADDTADAQRSFESEIPQAPGTTHTLASAGWENAVGLSRSDAEFVAQFRAACGWWETAASGKADAQATKITGQLEQWSALRTGPALEGGKSLIGTISSGLLSRTGSTQHAEAQRLYTVNCVNPREAAK